MFNTISSEQSYEFGASEAVFVNFHYVPYSYQEKAGYNIFKDNNMPDITKKDVNELGVFSSLLDEAMTLQGAAPQLQLAVTKNNQWLVRLCSVGKVNLGGFENIWQCSTEHPFSVAPQAITLFIAKAGRYESGGAVIYVSKTLLDSGLPVEHMSIKFNLQNPLQGILWDTMFHVSAVGSPWVTDVPEKNGIHFPAEYVGADSGSNSSNFQDHLAACSLTNRNSNTAAFECKTPTQRVGSELTMALSVLITSSPLQADFYDYSTLQIQRYRIVPALLSLTSDYTQLPLEMFYSRGDNEFSGLKEYIPFGNVNIQVGPSCFQTLLAKKRRLFTRNFSQTRLPYVFSTCNMPSTDEYTVGTTTYSQEAHFFKGFFLP